MIVEWPPHWNASELQNAKLFAFDNGIWQGKKPPFVNCNVIRNTDFRDDGAINFAKIARIPIEQRQLPKKALLPGDIIIERSGGGPQQPVGRVVLFQANSGTYSFSNFTSRVRVVTSDVISSEFLHKFLYFFHISGQTEALQRRTTGIRNLSFGDYLKTRVPLPPVTEQQAIVTLLKAAQKASEARERELALERERKSALMEYMFTHGVRKEPTTETELGATPKSWKVQRLDELAELFSGGTPSRKKLNWWKGDIPWASPKDMKRERLRDTQEHITKEAVQSGSRVVPAGTIFVVLRGMILAKDVPIAYTEVPMAFNQDMKAVVTCKGTWPEFLLYALVWRKSALVKNIGTSAHGTRRLNTPALAALRLPVPSLDEQVEIARVLGLCEQKLNALEVEIPLYKELYRVLLEEVMTGRVSTLIEERQAR